MKFKSINIETDDLIMNDFKSLVEIKDLKESEDFIAPFFKERDLFLKELFGSNERKIPDQITIEENANEEKLFDEIASPILSEKVLLTGWKNIENISGRLIENCGDTVVLECIIDRENSIFEERIFRSSLFEGYSIELGNLFYLRFFDRQNETKMEVHEGKGIVSKEDFPKLDFKELFNNSKLFKK